MLSQGRVGQDNVVSLRGGHLTLYMQRQAYESAGLQGKPHGATGSRNLRPRWGMLSFHSLVSVYSLTSQSSRVTSAQRRCSLASPATADCSRPATTCSPPLSLGCSAICLTVRFESSAAFLRLCICSRITANSIAPTPDPLAAFNPKYVTVSPSVIGNSGVALAPLGRPPSLLSNGDDTSSSSSAGGKRRRKSDAAIADSRLEQEEATTELYEWLSLVRLGSPRVKAGDDIDPYLSRYTVPGSDAGSDAGGLAATGDVSVLRWTGFFSPSWACQTLLDVVQAMQSTSSSSSAWFAVSVSGFSSAKGIAGDCAECTFFRPAGAPQEYLLWEIHSHE